MLYETHRDNTTLHLVCCSYIKSLIFEVFILMAPRFGNFSYFWFCNQLLKNKGHCYCMWKFDLIIWLHFTWSDNQTVSNCTIWYLQVILDVVYSHTAENGDDKPKLMSFRGIDNATYYICDQFGAYVSNNMYLQPLQCYRLCCIILLSSTLALIMFNAYFWDHLRLSICVMQSCKIWIWHREFVQLQPSHRTKFGD